MIVGLAIGFFAGAGFMGACVVWGAFVGITGRIIPHFSFGQQHPGEE